MVEEEKEELGDAIKEFNRGLSSHIEGNLERAFEHFKVALPTFQEFGVEEMIAGTFHEMGMVLQEQGKLEEAMDYYQKSLQLCKSIKYNAGSAKTLYQIGSLYEQQNDIITANEYYRKSQIVKTKKPGFLNFIIVVFLISGLGAIGMGLGGLSGVLQQFEPFFIPPQIWARFVEFLNNFGGLVLIIGILGLISGIGLLRLKSFGWVAGIITSLLTIIIISGIVFYWYLSKENIQELYQVK